MEAINEILQAFVKDADFAQYKAQLRSIAKAKDDSQKLKKLKSFLEQDLVKQKLSAILQNMLDKTSSDLDSVKVKLASGDLNADQAAAENAKIHTLQTELQDFTNKLKSDPINFIDPELQAMAGYITAAEPTVLKLEFDDIFQGLFDFIGKLFGKIFATLEEKEEQAEEFKHKHADLDIKLQGLAGKISHHKERKLAYADRLDQRDQIADAGQEHTVINELLGLAQKKMQALKSSKSPESGLQQLAELKDVMQEINVLYARAEAVQKAIADSESKDDEQDHGHNDRRDRDRNDEQEQHDANADKAAKSQQAFSGVIAKGGAELLMKQMRSDLFDASEREGLARLVLQSTALQKHLDADARAFIGANIDQLAKEVASKKFLDLKALVADIGVKKIHKPSKMAVLVSRLEAVKERVVNDKQDHNSLEDSGYNSIFYTAKTIWEKYDDMQDDNPEAAGQWLEANADRIALLEKSLDRRLEA